METTAGEAGQAHPPREVLSEDPARWGGRRGASIQGRLGGHPTLLVRDKGKTGGKRGGGKLGLKEMPTQGGNKDPELQVCDPFNLFTVEVRRVTPFWLWKSRTRERGQPPDTPERLGRSTWKKKGAMCGEPTPPPLPGAAERPAHLLLLHPGAPLARQDTGLTHLPFQGVQRPRQPEAASNVYPGPSGENLVKNAHAET